MKATGLRRVIGFVVGAALISGALIAAPRADADEGALKAAFDDYAAGRYEDALKKLQEYTATNPGDDEVYRVLRQVDEKVKLRALAAGGEHERMLRYLLDKARPAVEARRRDPDAIKALVEQVLSPELDVRRRASLELATKSGDYAVPYLLPALGSQDVEKVVNAIFALHAIGGEAVLPLSETLNTTDARLRGYAAVVLGDIRDPRALPGLRRLAETDADADVKAKATAAIQKIRPAGSMTAAESYVRLGQRYYANDPSVITEPDQVHNLWRWEGDALARYEVPAALFGYQLAQMHAHYALKLQPGNIAARSLLVRSVVAQALEGALLGEKAPEALKPAMTLATSQGFDAVSAALGDALTTKDWDVAAACCGLVAKTYGGQPLAGHPLGRALGAPQKAVQYAAAIAALHMSPATPFENSQQVPALAAQAASETALRLVFVIDDMDQCRGRLCQDLREGGYVVADEADGWRGVARVKAAPAVDVVIVRADLGAAGVIPSEKWRSTLAVIDELMSDFRTKNMRVVVIVAGETPEALAAKKEFLAAKYGDKLAGFIEEPLVATAYLPVVQAAIEKGDMNVERALALELATRAGDAFAATNRCCTAWDYKVAVDPLATNATDGASEPVRLAAIRGLGNLRAGGSAALATVVKNAEAPEALRVAAATALGQVLSANAPAGDEIDVLLAAAKGGGAVGEAAMNALGMVRSLPADAALKAFEDHRLDVGTKGE